MAYRPEDQRRDGDEEEEEEEEAGDAGYKTVKDAVLFAIDVSKSMLTRPPPSDDKKADLDSPTSAALKCAYQLMQQRIISHPNDMMGILLFGTEKSKFQGDDDEDSGMIAYPHCYLLSDLDIPSANDVKKLRSLVEDEEEAASLLVPSKEPVSMSNVLFAANQVFTTRAPNFSSRRLFLVTDNDNPHKSDKALRSAAAVRAKDLYDLGVVIELFPISRTGDGFNRSTFYDDIVYRPQGLDPEAPAAISKEAKTSSSGDGISLLQSLLSEINSKSAPRRALFSLPFEIGPGLKIGIKGYIIIKRQTAARTCYVWLGGEKPQIAVGTSSKIAEDTARTVEKVEIRKAYDFGGEMVSFTPEEIAAIRNFGEPTLKIVGFKPLSMLPTWANHRPPIFIYPSETDYVGSTRVFSALYQTLASKEKMAICWFIARKNAAPVLAAVIPSKPDDGDTEEGEPGVFPQGLWVVPLPFADDIRQNPETTLVRAPDEVVDGMRKVVEQLQLPKNSYDPTKYPNPALQWHYKILQALALEEDLPEQAEDKTIPRYRQIDKRAGEYVLEWGQALEEEYQKHVSQHGVQHKVASKRSAPASRAAPAKKVKTSDGAVPASASDATGDDIIKKHFEKGTLGKLKVAELKDWLLAKGIKGTGKKKDELVELVEEQLETK